ncbi:alpha/beta hydrolase [Nocardia testacea]|uniref:alpha/beta hydrolase n=1 Tax=Nocardia testacea TaxID=248551 RepID=UPI003A8B1745
MSRFDPEADIPDFFPRGVRSGIVDANLIAARLERIVREMGEGISHTLYRRARQAVQRGDRDLLLSDADAHTVLRNLLDERYLPPGRSVSSRTSIDGMPDNPQDLHRWWSGLSKGEKDEIFRADPFIGNRDGVPQKERNIYNKQNLQRLRRDAHENAHTDDIEFYDDLDHLLKSQPFLLSHLDEGRRFALSSGNSDYVDNAIVFLRPAGNFQPLGFAQNAILQLKQAAGLADPHALNSVTFWSNYDNPGAISEALFPHLAADGADALRRYHEGLRATHRGLDGDAGTSARLHTTTVGYSYGSVVAGHAAGGGSSLATDDMILIGSWGTGANQVGDLRLTGVEDTAQHIFTGLAPHDPIRFMPDTHGVMPSDPAFGATNFATAPARDFTTWNLLDHELDNYLGSANPSSRSIGLIATGHGDRVARM